MFAPSSRIVLLIYCYVGTWWFQNVRAANCYWNSPLCDLIRPGWCIYRYGLVIGRTSYESRDRLMGVHYALGREHIVSKLAIPGNY